MITREVDRRFNKEILSTEQVLSKEKDDTGIDVSDILHSLDKKEDKEVRENAKNSLIMKMGQILDIKGHDIDLYTVQGENELCETINVSFYEKITKPVALNPTKHPDQYIYLKSNSSRVNGSAPVRERIFMYFTNNPINPGIEDSQQVFAVGLAVGGIKDESFAIDWKKGQANVTSIERATKWLNRIEQVLPDNTPQQLPLLR